MRLIIGVPVAFPALALKLFRLYNKTLFLTLLGTHPADQFSFHNKVVNKHSVPLDPSEEAKDRLHLCAMVNF